ncbi:hypothetical protein Ancab_001122 [Ancistrocladus abbreviatus]
MVTENLFQRFLFPPPPSIFVTSMSVISFAGLANTGFKEIKGIHLQYSKLWNAKNSLNEPGPKQHISVPSRIGMLILYTPAFLFGAAAFFLFPDEGLKFFLLRLALTIHFLKRVLEVLFVHKYSGGMNLFDVLLISVSYFSATATMIYAQHTSWDFPEPSVNLTYAGIVLFLLGIGGNFYHHYILSTLRKKGEKEYKIPSGGLFNLVVCPHYLFEVLVFVGITFIAQTLYSLSFTLGTVLYLMGRSYAIRKWYVSKFEDFPTRVKAIIPYLF